MDFEFDDPRLMLCQEQFNALPSDERIFMTHYELASATTITDASLWKQYLMETKVNDWINQELTLFKEIQLRKLIKDATKNDRSVGAAQMLNALNKSFESDSTKEGNLFIYCYVPLDTNEQHAPNTSTAPRDLFERN